jgi:hypothetical protein
MKKSHKRSAKPVSNIKPVSSVEAADPLAVAAILRDAAKLAINGRSNPRRDRQLLAAAKSAQREAGSFTSMFQTVTAVNGTVELLYQMIEQHGDVPDDVNWASVGDLLDDARRRLGNVYCALHCLEKFERDQRSAE